MANNRRKYQDPADALLARRKPITPEHQQKITEGVRRFWAEARASLAKREGRNLNEFLNGGA